MKNIILNGGVGFLSKTTGSSKKYLMDVVLIRIILIFLLVFYHSFCPFTGGWTGLPIEINPVTDSYRLFGAISHHFRLEAMVFISGLLFGHTLKLHPERLNFNSCVTKKAKRLLLPGIMFSAIYYLMFYNLDAPAHRIIIDLLDGCGHLWFLPMIFWCFVLCYTVERSKISPATILVISMLATLLPHPLQLFGLGKLYHYFFYFYIGFAMKTGYIRNLSGKNKSWILAMLAISVCLSFAIDEMRILWDPETVYERALRSVISGICSFVCASTMIAALYSLANRPKVLNFLERHPALITVSGYCYGVYIYHQFILQYLYYKTDLVLAMPTMFPWVGFAVSLVLSLLFCFLTQKTRFGRYLIG